MRTSANPLAPHHGFSKRSLRCVILCLAGMATSAYGAGNTYTETITGAGPTTWTAATWQLNGGAGTAPNSTNAGDIAQFSSSSANMTNMVLNQNVTVGALEVTSTKNWVLGTPSGGFSFTLDNTGGVANPFGNTNAFIGTVSSGTIGVTPAIIIANTNLTIGAKGTGAVTLNGGITGTGDVYVASGSSAVITIQTGSLNNTGNLIIGKSDSSTSQIGTGAITISAVIGGNVNSITSSAAGTVTLSGSNTSYAGTTTLSAGTLLASNSGVDNALTALGTGSVALNSGTLQLRANGAGSNQTIITGNGTTGNNVTVGGNATIDVNRSSANTGNKFQFNNLTIGASTLSVTGGNTYALQFSGSTTLTGSATINASSAPVTLVGAVGDGGNNYGLTKSGGSSLVLQGNNTYTGLTTISAGTLTLSGSNNGSGGMVIGGGLNINNAYALGSGSLVFNASTAIDNTSGTAVNVATVNAQTWNNSWSFGGSNALNLGSGTATITTGTITVTTNGTAAVTVGAIAESGGSRSLAKSGTGTLVLAGASTFTGGVTINAGVLQLASAGALNSSGQNSITFGASAAAGTKLQLNGNSVTISDLKTNATPGSPVVENANITAATLTINGGGGTYAGVLQNGVGGGALSLVKTGAGTSTLNGLNTYTGSTTVNGGTLLLDLITNTTGVISSSSDLLLGGGTLNIKGKATGVSSQALNSLTLTGSSSSAISVNVNGGGGTTVNLGSTWTRNLNSTLALTGTSGATIVTTANPTLSNGILGYATFNDGTGTGFATITSGTVLSKYTGATTLLNTTDDATGNYLVTSSTIHNGGDWSVNSLQVTAAATGSTLDLGGDTVTLTSGGILNSGTNYAISNGQLGLTNSEVIFHVASATLTVSASVSAGATGSLVKDGAGTLTLTGGNIYRGATVIGGGVLQIGSGGTQGSIHSSSNIILSNGGTLTLNHSDSIIFSNVIKGVGNVTQSGAGMATLGSSNTYDGVTSVNSGTLSVSSIGNWSAGNTTATSLGSPTTAANGQVNIGFSNSNSTLQYTGTGETTNRTISFGNHSNSGNSIDTLDASGSGALIVQNIAMASAGTGTVTRIILSGTNTNDNTIQDALIEGNIVSSLLTSINKSGPGTWVLSNAGSTYQGGTVISAGTLVAEGNASVSSFGSATFSGTTMTLTSGLTTLQVGDWIYSPGAVGSANKALQIKTIIGSGSYGLNAGAANNGTFSDVEDAIASGLFGNSHGAVILGDAATTTNNSSPTLLIDGAYTIAHPITVANQATSGTYTIGGRSTTASATFSGLVTINRDLTVSQAVASGTNGLNITGGITSGTTGARTVTFVGPGTINVNTTGISDNGANTMAVNVNGGTTILSAANSYTGATTITSGTLQLGAGGTAGSLSTSSAITNNSALVFNRSDTLTQGTNFSGAGISGTGSLKQAGTGSVVLTASNSYSGQTIVSGGTLALGSAGSIGSSSKIIVGDTLGHNGAKFDVSAVTGGFHVASGQTLAGHGTVIGSVTVDSGAHLAPGNSNGTLTVGSLTLSGGSILDYEFNGGPTNDLTMVSASGGLTINGGGINLFAEGTTNPWTTTGTYNLIGYTGALNGTGISALSVLNQQSGYAYNFGTTTVGGTNYVTLSITTSGSGVTSTTYTLTASASSTNILTGGSTNIASVIQNTGSGTADTLNYTGLSGTSSSGGTVSGSSTSGGPLAQGASGTNSGLVFTGTHSGIVTVTPVITGNATNATAGGNATQTGSSSVTVNVFDPASLSGAQSGTGTVVALTALNQSGTFRASAKVTADNGLNNNQGFTDVAVAPGTQIDPGNSVTVASFDKTNRLNGTYTATKSLGYDNVTSSGSAITGGTGNTANVGLSVTVSGQTAGAGQTFNATLFSGQKYGTTTGSTSSGYGLTSNIAGDPHSGTTATLINGTASANTTVSMSFNTVPSAGAIHDTTFRSSDILSLGGIVATGTLGPDHSVLTDKYVLQLSYDPSAVGAQYIGWYDADQSQWVNAIAGNSAGGHYDGGGEFAGSYAAYLATLTGPQQADLAFQLNAFGYDASTHTAWAVLDHNSEFAVIPEPSTWGMILSGFGMLIGIQRLRKRRVGI